MDINIDIPALKRESSSESISESKSTLEGKIVFF